LRLSAARWRWLTGTSGARAAKLLGELRHKKSVSRLSALLSDPDSTVRYEAVEALRKIGDIKVLGRLISAA